MSIQRLSHIGICVNNLEQSKQFYCEVFGFEQVAELELPDNPSSNTLLELPATHIQAAFLERDGTRLELLYYKTPGQEPVDVKKMNQTGITHLSFRVQQMDDVIAAVEGAGGSYLAQTNVDNPDFMMRACFMLDPNGVRIELLEAPGDPNLLPGQS